MQFVKFIIYRNVDYVKKCCFWILYYCVFGALLVQDYAF